MIAAIEITGEVTSEEVAKTVSRIKVGQMMLPKMSGPLQGYAWLQAATADQLAELIAYHATVLAKEIKALDDANKFRPSYAPRGRLTTTQVNAQIGAREATRLHRTLQYLHAERSK